MSIYTAMDSGILDSFNEQNEKIPQEDAEERTDPTETPAFKAWFANSKVVDNSGDPVPVFHGSESEFESFDYNFIGDGHDMEGPGFYFTNKHEDAFGYAEKGKIYEVYLRIQNPVPITGEVDRAQLERLALMAVGKKNEEGLYDLEDSDEYWETDLSNWGEHPVSAYHSLIESVYASYHNEPHQAFMQMWVDAFGTDSIRYLKGMISLGYDGVIIEKKPPFVHYVVFDPRNIKAVVSEGFSEEENIYKEDGLQGIQKRRRSPRG